MADKLRHIAEKANNLLELFPVLAVLGSRQVGKTTLVKSLRPQWRYYDLESPVDFDLMNRDPDFFFAQNPQHLILDEAQKDPALLDVLRGVIDKHRTIKNRFILTGFSSPELLKHVTESLAGRVAVLELGTFKSSEFYGLPLSSFYQAFTSKITAQSWERLAPQQSTGQVRNFWVHGGYPEPVLASDPRFFAQWMEQYRLSYINRDIRELFPKLDLVRFRRFVQMLARLSGTIINKAELAAAVEVSEPTIRDYLDIVHGTFFWRKLTSLERDTGKALTKMPRGQIRDSGLLHFMLRLSTLDEIEGDPIVGRSFESFVIEEIIKGIEATTAVNWSAHYYRTKSRAEIDLVLDGPFGLLPIEIKYGVKTTASDLRTLRSFVKDQNLPLGLVVNCSDKLEWIAPGILQVPVGCL